LSEFGNYSVRLRLGMGLDLGSLGLMDSVKETIAFIKELGRYRVVEQDGELIVSKLSGVPGSRIRKERVFAGTRFYNEKLKTRAKGER